MERAIGTLVVLIVVGIVALRWFDTTPGGRDVDSFLDHATGVTAVSQFQQMKATLTQAETSQIRNAVLQYTAQYNRPPASLAVLQESGTLGAGGELDSWKQPYEGGLQGHVFVVRSAGPNRIYGDGDDIPLTIPLE